MNMRFVDSEIEKYINEHGFYPVELYIDNRSFNSFIKQLRIVNKLPKLPYSPYSIDEITYRNVKIVRSKEKIQKQVRYETYKCISLFGNFTHIIVILL